MTAGIAYVDRKFATHICLAEGSLGQVSKKKGNTIPRQDGGVKYHRNKSGITRLHPDGWVTNDPKFVSDIFKEYLTDNNIRHRKMTPYRPQAN